MADLQREQRRLRALIKTQEAELRDRVKEVPGELLAAGANAIVPRFLAGKMTANAITFLKNLVNKLFAKKEEGEKSPPLFGAALRTGLFAVLKMGFNAFMNRKKA